MCAHVSRTRTFEDEEGGGLFEEHDVAELPQRRTWRTLAHIAGGLVVEDHLHAELVALLERLAVAHEEVVEAARARLLLENATPEDGGEGEGNGADDVALVKDGRGAAVDKEDVRLRA